MKKTILMLLVAVFALTSVEAKKKVLGTVSYSFTVSGEGSEMVAAMMPTSLVVKYAEKYVSVEMTGGMVSSMLGKMITDGVTGESYMIKDAEETIYIMSNDELTDALSKSSDPKVVAHKDKKKINGYKCTKYTVTTSAEGMEVTQVIWATKKLEVVKYEATGSMSNMAGFDINNFNVDGFPMSIEVGIPNSEMTITMEVTDIKLESIPESYFEKPEGYVEKPLSEMQMF